MPSIRVETELPIILASGVGRIVRPTAIRLVLTKQVFPGDDWPSLTCKRCKSVQAFIKFLHLASLCGEDLELQQRDACVTCSPRSRTYVLLKPRMPVKLAAVRGADGAPLRWFDKKSRRWRAISKLQFRFMDKTSRPLVLRAQPYADRHV